MENYESLKSQLDKNEQADYKFRERRHPEWTENLQLYRDKVVINRLTQRQSINVPFIKGIIKTTIANTDEFPDIEFEELGNDKGKEIIINELWKDFVSREKMEIKDIIDKKQDFLYGKTWTKLNVIGGRITSEIKDPFDMLVDRYSDPADLDSADHLSEHGIFRTLSQLEANPMFDKGAIRRLKIYYGTRDGLIKAEEATRIMQQKNERMEAMGVSDMNDPMLGQVVVELKTHLQKIYDLKDQTEHVHLIVLCNAGLENEILFAKPLIEVMGVDFFPYVTWSDDPERLDHYPDGVADIARNPNKLLNAMISAVAENRILRNFKMHYYNSNMEGFVPQTFQPVPFGWYGIPVPEGQKLQDVMQAVDIPDLTESIDEMDYVKKIVETAVAANTTLQGDVEQRKVTLGEVELATAAAKERITSIAKFYMLAQKEKGDKWARILNANGDKLDSVKLYKKSHKGNYFEKTVSGKDWKSDKGYSCRAVSSTEREKESIDTINKLNAVKAQFPQNLALTKIYGKKMLEFGKLNPDEVKQVLDEEEQRMKTSVQAGAVDPQSPQLTPQPNAVQPA